MGEAAPDPPSSGAWPAASIAFYQDGPFVVRGTFEIVGQDGERVDAGRRTVALCRCGKSRMRPFCDGTHRSVKFRAAGMPEGDRGTARGSDQSSPPPGARALGASWDRQIGEGL